MKVELLKKVDNAIMTAKKGDKVSLQYRDAMQLIKDGSAKEVKK